MEGRGRGMLIHWSGFSAGASGTPSNSRLIGLHFVSVTLVAQTWSFLGPDSSRAGEGSGGHALTSDLTPGRKVSSLERTFSVTSPHLVLALADGHVIPRQPIRKGKLFPLTQPPHSSPQLRSLRSVSRSFKFGFLFHIGFHQQLLNLPSSSSPSSSSMDCNLSCCWQNPCSRNQSQSSSWASSPFKFTSAHHPVGSWRFHSLPWYHTHLLQGQALATMAHKNQGLTQARHCPKPAKTESEREQEQSASLSQAPPEKHLHQQTLQNQGTYSIVLALCRQHQNSNVSKSTL